MVKRLPLPPRRRCSETAARRTLRQPGRRATRASPPATVPTIAAAAAKAPPARDETLAAHRRPLRTVKGKGWLGAIQPSGSTSPALAVQRGGKARPPARPAESRRGEASDRGDARGRPDSLPATTPGPPGLGPSGPKPPGPSLTCSHPRSGPPEVNDGCAHPQTDQHE